MSLDIVIPVYNEGENILKVLDSLKRSVKAPYRILICYDKDEDNTLEALKTYRDANHPLRLVKNRLTGVHGAIATGFEESTADAVLIFPADDTYNAGLIDSMLEAVARGSDIVAPSRFMPGGCMRGCPWLKAGLVRAAAFMLYHFAGLPTHDPTNGFRLFSKRVIREVPIESREGFAFSLELLVKCHRLGWRIKETPALWFERAKGRSRFRIFRWLPIYLKWFFYAFGTAFQRRRAVLAWSATVWFAAVTAYYFFCVVLPKLQGRF